jgi:hypothetical protein
MKKMTFPLGRCVILLYVTGMRCVLPAKEKGIDGQTQLGRHSISIATKRRECHMKKMTFPLGRCVAGVCGT